MLLLVPIALGNATLGFCFVLATFVQQDVCSAAKNQHMQMVPSLQHLAGSCCDGAQHSACCHKSQSLWELLLQIPTRGNCFHKFQLVGIAFISSNSWEFYCESQLLWELLLQIPTRGNCYYKFQLVGMLL